MDALNIDNGKVEKSNVMSRFVHLKNVTKLFRIIEFRFLLIFLTWVSAHVPFFVKISAEYARQLMTIVFSPLFIFILSNIIVVTLLFQSSCFFPRYYQEQNEIDIYLYEEFILNNDYYMNFTYETPFPVQEPDENIVYLDKQTILEEKKYGENMKFVEALEGLKVHRRSQSESTIEGKTLGVDNCKKQFRRLETEKCWKVINSDETLAETVYMVDEMNNEEFQRAIEDFIAKQIKFHHEEKLSVVISSHNWTSETSKGLFKK